MGVVGVSSMIFLRPNISLVYSHRIAPHLQRISGLIKDCRRVLDLLFCEFGASVSAEDSKGVFGLAIFSEWMKRIDN
jgi:hypothetical protein